MTVFEYLAHRQPEVLLRLEAMGLLRVEDHLPAGVAVLMRHAAWRRVGRRIRQVRCA
ncbi:MAG: hypothetical protein NUV93_09185 [Firmicutes bacterium]|jgi:hypothetical protein|nr:hypothetical protein [Bacillota bacterium]